MGSKSPKTPDYRGAAEAEAAANRSNLEYQTASNRPDTFTPWGSQTWSGTPGQPGYSTSINLSPEQQAALDSQQALAQGRSDTALGMMGDLRNDMNTPEGFWEGLPQAAQGDLNVPTYGEGLTDYATPGQTGVDLSGLPDAPGGPQAGGAMAGPDYSGLQGLDMPEYDPRFAEAFYGRSESLLAPQMEQQRKALNTQLRNQGLTGQSEAYQTGTGNLQRGQGETLGRLAQDAVLQGSMEQQRQFGRQLAGRQQGAREEEFGAQFGLGADAQRFGQEMGASTFGEQQRAARLGEQKGQVDDAFRSAQFQNQLRGQQSGEQLMQGGQQFSQEQQAQQFQNDQRQRAVVEQLQKEGWSLNKINALISGNQVGMPEMPGFVPAGTSAGPQYLNAANRQGQFDLTNSTNQWNAFGGIGSALTAGLFG